MMKQTPKIWTGDDLTEDELSAIASLLRSRRDFDLGMYKDRCIRRRIAKRLRACAVADVDAYLQLLESDSDELDTMLATISIHVSQFFRNPDTFRTLERKILPELCQKITATGRRKATFWCVGCATGEEPYSLALLVKEMNLPDLEIQILASDVSNPVLAIAEQGLFERTRLSEVPSAALEKYFSREGQQFRLNQQIRNQVRFFRHNIMSEEVYPKVDLILCRNVLIYFTRAEQDRILARFAEAMPEYGRLVLGRSETMVGEMRRYFCSEFPVQRIYRRSDEPVPIPEI